MSISAFILLRQSPRGIEQGKPGTIVAPIQVLMPAQMAYDTFEKAVAAAGFDYAHNVWPKQFGPTPALETKVYKNDDGEAIVEVRQPNDAPSRCYWFYKVIPATLMETPEPPKE